MLAFGWRGAFFATGAGRPRRSRGLWIGPLPRPPAGPAREALARRARHGAGLFAAPTLWAMALGNVGSGYMNWFYAAWLPGYLETARHFSRAADRLGGVDPLRCSASLGSLSAAGLRPPRRAGLSPIAQPQAADRRGPRRSARLSPASPSSRRPARLRAWPRSRRRSSAPTSPAPRSGRWRSPPRRPGGVGSVGAVQNFGGFLGGALAPIVTGFSVEATHSFAAALATTAAAALRRGAGLSVRGAPADRRLRRVRPLPSAATQRPVGFSRRLEVLERERDRRAVQRRLQHRQVRLPAGAGAAGSSPGGVLTVIVRREPVASRRQLPAHRPERLARLAPREFQQPARPRKR